MIIIIINDNNNDIIIGSIVNKTVTLQNDPHKDTTLITTRTYTIYGI